jgi:hypothetical protein
MTLILTFIASLLLAWSQPSSQSSSAAAPQRFDMLVRADFFAGFAGSEERLAKAMTACEAALAADPKNAETQVEEPEGVSSP